MNRLTAVVAAVLVAVGVLAGCSTFIPASGPPSPLPSVPARTPGPMGGTALSGSDEGGPALTDTTGAAVPAAVADGVRRIDAALRSGTTASLRDLYDPAPGAAGWATTASRLDDPAHRTRLIAALRNPPEPRPEVAYLYADGDHGLGITDDGKLAFVGVGQKPHGSTAPGSVPAGSYIGHGRSLEIDASGRGTYRFRTYDECPSDTPGVPCEYRGPEQVAVVTLLVSRSGSGLTARVLTSNDEPEMPTGSTLPVASPRSGVVTLGRGDTATTFCGDGVSDPDCGA